MHAMHAMQAMHAVPLRRSPPRLPTTKPRTPRAAFAPLPSYLAPVLWSVVAAAGIRSLTRRAKNAAPARAVASPPSRHWRKRFDSATSRSARRPVNVRRPTAASPAVSTAAPPSTAPRNHLHQRRPFTRHDDGPHRPVQVITDIDDTVKSSGGLRLAGIPLGGIDTRFPRGLFYPGVFEFALQLSTFNSDLASPPSAPTPKTQSPRRIQPLPVAVLTARAREFKFALALTHDSLLSRRYRLAGEKRGWESWGIGPVLYGSVAEWVWQEGKGKRKFQNFKILRQKQKLELKAPSYIYIGDTGERDQEAGECMLRHFPTSMKALFLHDVSPAKVYSAPRPDTAINGVPVVYFRTYVGAAVKAVQHGCMSLHGLRCVLESAEHDMGQIVSSAVSNSFAYDDIAVLASRAAEPWRELHTDAVQARRLLAGLPLLSTKSAAAAR